MIEKIPGKSTGSNSTTESEAYQNLLLAEDKLNSFDLGKKNVNMAEAMIAKQNWEKALSEYKATQQTNKN